MNEFEIIEAHLKQRDIAERALRVWEKMGHHHHRDLEHWLQAEAQRGADVPHHRWAEPVPPAPASIPSPSSKN
jgi:hypothetical protein